MSIDRELLRQAWPEGYLAMRGVSTVGGYVCMGRNTWCHIENYDIERRESGAWETGRDGYEDAQAPVGAGILLPNVDPTDVATWACLKTDVASATWMMPGKRLEGTGRQKTEFIWVKELNGWHLGAVTWRGADQEEGRCASRRFPDIDTDDPAEALVRARIQVREETGR